MKRLVPGMAAPSFGSNAPFSPRRPPYLCAPAVNTISNTQPAHGETCPVQSKPADSQHLLV